MGSSPQRRNWIISKGKVREFIAAHPALVRTRPALMTWVKVATWARWENFADVRETYPSADQVGRFVVSNVGGNKIRLVAFILYNTRPRRVYIKHILTHREYDKGDWRE